MSTLNDVAKEAGVSIASVSRYLNNSGNISEEIKERIQAAVDKLDYRLDSAARSLKTGKFYRIGIISPATGPHYWEIISSIENNLASSHYYTNIIFTREPKYGGQPQELIGKVRNVDGIIIMPLDNDIDYGVIKSLQRQGDKFVVLDRIYRNKNYYQIGVDNLDIGRQAAEILLEKGHREFLYLKGIDDLTSSVDRGEGFRQGLKEAGITLTDERILSGDFSPEKITALLEDKLDTLPSFSAVFAANDMMALAFMKSLSEKGLHAPKDYSIIGVDDLDFLPYISPGLNTFRQPLQTMGALAANMLVSQIEGFSIREKNVLLKAQYIERDSVAGVSP